MNRKYKKYLKLNVMSLFFIAISFISVTLAWFAYSGMAKVSTDIEVKSWLIEFEKKDKTVSNNIVISLSEIYPGMETLHETIKIKNKGDSDARLSASIVSARILDEEFNSEKTEQKAEFLRGNSEGGVFYLDCLDRLKNKIGLGETWYLLCRNKFFLENAQNFLHENLIPYWTEDGFFINQKDMVKLS